MDSSHPAGQHVGIQLGERMQLVIGDGEAWIADQGRRVIAVDLRGRGRSDRDPKPERYMPATYAEDVVAALDSLKIPRALFVGTSLGGIVTMTLAGKHLDRIGGAG